MKKIFILICLTINLGCFSATKSIVYNSLKYTIDTTNLTAELTGPESKDVILNDLCIPDFVIDKDIQYAVTSIADYAFSSSKVIEGTLTLGQNIENIGYEAFRECNIKGTLIIPNSVTSINCRAFYGCSGITTLVIGKSVKEIGEDFTRGGGTNYNSSAGHAFYECYGLERIICLASNAPNTWNYGWLNKKELPNFTYYNVKLYVPADFSGDGSCSFYRSDLGTFKSTGEWGLFKNKYVLEDSEFAGYLDGTYGSDDGNGDDNPGSDLEGNYVNLYLNKEETRDIGEMLGVIYGEGQSEGSDAPIASTWSSSNENIVQVSNDGKCYAADFGTALITAYDADGEKLGSLKIFVSPIISIEFGNGIMSYSQHVVYNSLPSIFIAAPNDYEIISVEQDGADVTEAVLANEGYYTPASPIIENSTIKVSLRDTRDPSDLNGDGVVDVSDLNFLIERIMNNN